MAGNKFTSSELAEVGFPTRNGSQVLWANSLGRPVTYECVLVSTDNAALLYTWADAGVVVEIRL